MENIKEELDYELYLGASIDCVSIKEIVQMDLEKYIKTSVNDLKVFPGRRRKLFSLAKIKDICKKPFSNK